MTPRRRPLAQPHARPLDRRGAARPAARLRPGRAQAGRRPGRRRRAPGPRHDLRPRPLPRAARAPPRRPPAAQPAVDLGAGRAARRDRGDAGVAAQAQLRDLARGRDDDDARAPERGSRGRDRPALRARPDRVGRDRARDADAAGRRRDATSAPRPQDPAKAVRRMQPPSEDAAALLANHGIVPGSLVAAAPAPVTPAAATTPPPRRRPRPLRRPTRQPLPRPPPPAAPVATPAPATPAADDDLADPCQRRSRRRTGLGVLIERRIGLLFAVFLGMLVLAGARAGWLGIVRATRSSPPRPRSRRPTSSYPPAAARSATRTGSSWRSPSPRRRSRRRPT